MRIAEIFRSRQGEGRLTGVESVFVRVSGCPLRCRFCDTPYASWKPEGEELSIDAIWERVLEIGAEPAFSIAGLQRPTRGASAAASRANCSNLHPPISILHPPSSNLQSPSLQSPSLQSPSLQSPSLPVSFPGHVVLTGGEPMWFEEIVPLAARFRAAGWHITVETSGTRYQPIECDLMSVSPKLSNARSAKQELPAAPGKQLVWHAPHVIRRLATSYDCQWKFVVGSPADCREVLDYLGEFREIDRRRVLLMPLGVDAAALAATAGWLAPYCREHGFAFCPRRQIEWYGNRRGA